jgi:hypothetical protein
VSVIRAGVSLVLAGVSLVTQTAVNASTVGCDLQVNGPSCVNRLPALSPGHVQEAHNFVVKGTLGSSSFSSA